MIFIFGWSIWHFSLDFTIIISLISRREKKKKKKDFCYSKWTSHYYFNLIEVNGQSTMRSIVFCLCFCIFTPMPTNESPSQFSAYSYKLINYEQVNWRPWKDKKNIVVGCLSLSNQHIKISYICTYIDIHLFMVTISNFALVASYQNWVPIFTTTNSSPLAFKITTFPTWGFSIFIIFHAFASFQCPRDRPIA